MSYGTDHHHYGYAGTHHDHREYAQDRHDHDGDYAALHHRHYGDESTVRGLREDLGRAEARIGDLEGEAGDLRRQLADALDRIAALEKQMPREQQLQLEADQAAADLAESGYDRHGTGCGCPFCCFDPEDDGEQGGEPAEEPGSGPDPERPETWEFTGPEEPGPDPEEDR